MIQLCLLHNFKKLIILYVIWNIICLITGLRLKVWKVFACSYTGIVGSTPTQGMDVCVLLVCVCVGSGLVAGWSPVEGVLPSVLGCLMLQREEQEIHVYV
jgi:hypothetical protein